MSLGWHGYVLVAPCQQNLEAASLCCKQSDATGQQQQNNPDPECITQ